MENLPGDWRAQARYGELCTALGGEPVEGFSRAVLARLAAWVSDDDIAQVAYLIRHSAERRTDPLLALLRELAPAVRSSTETTHSGEVVVILPQRLAREVMQMATAGAAPEHD
jgi:hypothetical protein